MIAAKCSITSRTVQRIIVTLQGQDLLVIEPRYRADGSRSSNRYRIPLAAPHDKLSREGDTSVQGDPTPVSWGGDTGVVARTTTEPSIEPPQQPRSKRSDRLEAIGGGGLSFPKGLNLAQCEALRAQTADLTNTQAQQFIDELVGRMEVAEVKDPIRCTTLVQRLRRGEFVPGLALKVDERRRLAKARAQASGQIDSAALATLRDAATRLPPS